MRRLDSVFARIATHKFACSEIQAWLDLGRDREEWFLGPLVSGENLAYLLEEWKRK